MKSDNPEGEGSPAVPGSAVAGTPNAVPGNASSSRDAGKAPIVYTPKDAEASPSGSGLEVKLASFNRYGKGDMYLVYQPKNKAAGARLVPMEGLKFTAAVQNLSSSVWDKGEIELDKSALNELKQLGIGGTNAK